MSKILKSFKCAIKGILYSIKNERNMRVHTVIAMYVVVFSFFFNLTPGKYCVLSLAISAVIIAEMFNSAIEGLLDIMSKEYSPSARAIKDIAAGAVLVASGFSVIIGFALFNNLNTYKYILTFLCNHPVALTTLLISILLSWFYIFWGPAEIKNKIINLIFKIKKI